MPSRVLALRGNKTIIRHFAGEFEICMVCARELTSSSKVLRLFINGEFGRRFKFIVSSNALSKVLT